MFAAARIGDPVTHDMVVPSGVIGPPITPPAGGPVIIEGMPAAYVTCTTACSGATSAGPVHPPVPGPQPPIVKGSLTVHIYNQPAARWVMSGDVSGCGVFLGDPKLIPTRTVFIGDVGVGIGSPQQLSCQQIWEHLDGDAQTVASISDPIARNRVISARYAEMYLRNKDLRWSGAAAFASKQVGCGMQSAKDIMDASQQSLETYEDLNDLSMRYPWIGVDPHGGGAAAGGQALAETFARFRNDASRVTYENLAKGNEALFSEVYPAMRFYNEYGMERLRECAEDRFGELSHPLIRAFEQINAGRLDVGAEEMLRHEQRNTLQEAVYNNEKFASILRLNQRAMKYTFGLAQFFGAEEIKVSFTPECEGGREVVFEEDDLSSFNQRWPYAKEVANTFEELASQEETLTDQHLRTIINRGQ